MKLIRAFPRLKSKNAFQSGLDKSIRAKAFFKTAILCVFARSQNPRLIKKLIKMINLWKKSKERTTLDCVLKK